jgi:hypothetical protein
MSYHTQGNNNNNMSVCPPGTHSMPDGSCMDDNDPAMSNSTTETNSTNSTVGTNSTNSTVGTNSTSTRRTAPKLNLANSNRKINNTILYEGESITPPTNILQPGMKTRKTRGGVSNQFRHQHIVMVDEHNNGYTDTKILTGQEPHFHKVERGYILISGNPLHSHT